MRYRIISANFIQDLIDSVNDAIKDGWKPLGNITISDRDVFYQAMIKE